MSNKIELLPGELVVLSSFDNLSLSNTEVLTLTNKRVRYDSRRLGQSSLISITLGSVASCSLITKSYPFLLILAVLAVLIAVVLAGISQDIGNWWTLIFIGNWWDLWWDLIFIAAIFVVVYFVTRKTVISVASNGGQEISMSAKGMNRKAIIEFIEAIEREKLIHV